MSQIVGPESRVGKRAEQKRRWDREHLHDPCPECGGPKCRHNARCINCAEDHRARRRALIERMWAEGATIREIREAIGSPGWSAGVHRSRGWNLPHRRTPEQVARIRAGRYGG